MYEKIKNKDTWFHRLDEKYRLSGWIAALATILMSGVILYKLFDFLLPGYVVMFVHCLGSIAVFHIFEKRGWIRL